MEVELKKYRTYVRDLKFMLICSGVWPTSGKASEILAYFSRFGAGFTLGFVLVNTFILCMRNTSNLTYFFKQLSLVISFASGLLKVIIMVQNQKNLKFLNEGLSAKFESDLEDPDDRIHLLYRLPTFSRFFYSFDYMIVISIGMHVFMTISFIRKGKYVVLYPVVFSYEPGYTVYWIVLITEIVGGSYLWSVTCGSDLVIGYYSFHMVGELRLLSSRFRRLKSGDNYRKDLKDCIDRNCMLVDAIHTLERVFGFLITWLAVSCAIALGPLIFQISKTQHFSATQIVYTVSYMLVKYLQAYILAWFGTIVTHESQACLNAAYESFWRGSGDVRFMNDVLIVLSQKPLIFNALGIMYLDMNMFTKIVNTSVSYFFLLETLSEKS